MTRGHYLRKRTAPEVRFWAKVDRSGGPDACWPWTGHRGPAGYGRFALDGKHPIHASRASWIIHNGPLPDGLFALHTCDNKPCVNPAHLYAGTKRDNARDASERGQLRNNGQNTIREAALGIRRFGPPRRGVDSPDAKLTQEAVDDIRASWPRISQPKLATKYGVTQSAIWRVIHGHSYKAA
jgi:hypothetical protein